jgi:rhamnopyranosyl-N-acetylglucosaminyl-diphospho-decaprenol beta-1,3/1,4-galactofuranosyltransferase
MASPARVLAVVVTYNRKAMLAECLAALARQTHPLAGVILVDNASTDGTEAYVAQTGAAGALEVAYVRVTRNGGGAEGFHYGVKHALARPSDWLWLMDDDCEPADGCLAALLGSAAAADPATAVVCPAVVSADDRLLPLNRLLRARRLVRSPLVPLPAAAYEAPQARIDTASFVGPLIRTADAAAAGLPLREVFIRFDDIEYVDRLGAGGTRGVWNVSAARIRHKEPVPLVDVSLAGTLRAFLRRREFAGQWKHLYGVRNLIFAGRRHGWMSRANALGIGLQNVLLFLLLGEHRRRLAQLAALYTYDGLRGRFANLAPADWPALADAPSVREHLRAHRLRYDAETDSPPRPLVRGPGSGTAHR